MQRDTNPSFPCEKLPTIHDILAFNHSKHVSHRLFSTDDAIHVPAHLYVTHVTKNRQLGSKFFQYHLHYANVST